MSSAAPGFHVIGVDYERELPALRAVRDTVFVQEQQVPAALEWDAIDRHCRHVLARDIDGIPIGTGRLVPPLVWLAAEHGLALDAESQQSGIDDPRAARIGRMAVLAPWRSRGVGEAMLAVLLEEARRLGWRKLQLHAQVSAQRFYARHGFVPEGPRFTEAGIVHQSMHRTLDAPTAVDGREAAISATGALIARTRRELRIYCRNLDPGLLDQPEIVDALRALATRRHKVEIRILLQDAAAPQRNRAPVLGLAQRLSSSFAFREANDPADRAFASAYLVNDDGGYYFRTLGHRFEGECDLHDPGRARQLADAFDPVWERSRPCTEYRALEL